MPTIDQIQKIAQKMIYDDVDRDVAFAEYREMYHNGWNLPDKIKSLPWIRKVISSDPHDAIKAGVRILSTLPISINFQPLAPDLENKKRANEIERVLEWNLNSADRRRSKKVVADIVESCLLYDAVAVQVIDLDYQIQTKQALNADTKRENAARRYSRFVIQTYNPRDVHVRYSGIMPEAVLLVQIRHAQDVIDEWGTKALALEGIEELAKQPHGQDFVTYYDYWDYEVRAVWLVVGAMGNIPEAVSGEALILVDPQEGNPLPFLPWVALMGGSTLESDPLHKYQPLLYAIYTSGAWETQNIVKTLEVSEAIAHTGSPRYVEEGNNPQEGDIDYMSPERIAKEPPMNTLKPLPPPEIDAALMTIDAMQAAQISKSTIASVLQGGDLPAGIAFATLNLATQTAVGVLKPFKHLAEQATAEVLTLMMLWADFTGESIYGYSTEKTDTGAGLVIPADEIEPSGIYIEVELHPDAPTDRQQRVNTAAIAVGELDLPKEYALEDIGVTDPQTAIKTRWMERLVDHYLELEMQRDVMMMEMEMQMAMQEHQAALQQQQIDMQQQQMGGAFGGLGGEVPEETGGIGQGPRAVPRGMGVNPAAGGESPAMANPEETRELVTGEDMLGNEVML